MFVDTTQPTQHSGNKIVKQRGPHSTPPRFNAGSPARNRSRLSRPLPRNTGVSLRHEKPGSETKCVTQNIWGEGSNPFLHGGMVQGKKVPETRRQPYRNKSKISRCCRPTFDSFVESLGKILTSTDSEFVKIYLAAHEASTDKRSIEIRKNRSLRNTTYYSFVEERVAACVS